VTASPGGLQRSRRQTTCRPSRSSPANSRPASRGPSAIFWGERPRSREARAIHAGLRLAREASWNPDGYVMVTRFGQPVNRSNLSSAWRSFCRRNDLAPVTFHKLRHSFATNRFDAGEDLVTVQKLLRHSKASTTADIYLHKTQQQQRQAIERQDAEIAAAIADATGAVLRPICDSAKSRQQQAV
jgi:hypothetical protein